MVSVVKGVCGNDRDWSGISRGGGLISISNSCGVIGVCGSGRDWGGGS